MRYISHNGKFDSHSKYFAKVFLILDLIYYLLHASFEFGDIDASTEFDNNLRLCQIVTCRQITAKNEKNYLDFCAIVCNYVPVITKVKLIAM